MDTADYRLRFEKEVSQDDDEIDLIEVALVIAGEHNSEIDISACRQQMAQLAEGARFCVRTDDKIEDIALGLCKYLNQNQGFSGNKNDYDNPENSFLDKVLESRKGIPISIALVYIGVGQVLGLQISGISFPGHFLLKLVREREVIIDPFYGKLMSTEDCAQMLSNAGEPAERLEHYLHAATNKDIILRMLNNLKLNYLARRDFAESLSYCERRLLLQPNSPQDVLDRGLLFEQLECFQSAIDQFERFLTIAPEVSFAASVRSKIEKLRGNAFPLQ